MAVTPEKGAIVRKLSFLCDMVSIFRDLDFFLIIENLHRACEGWTMALYRIFTIFRGRK